MPKPHPDAIEKMCQDITALARQQIAGIAPSQQKLYDASWIMLNHGFTLWCAWKGVQATPEMVIHVVDAFMASLEDARANQLKQQEKERDGR